jgi:hypothetical protein
MYVFLVLLHQILLYSVQVFDIQDSQFCRTKAMCAWVSLMEAKYMMDQQLYLEVCTV